MLALAMLLFSGCGGMGKRATGPVDAPTAADAPAASEASVAADAHVVVDGLSADGGYAQVDGPVQDAPAGEVEVDDADVPADVQVVTPVDAPAQEAAGAFPEAGAGALDSQMDGSDPFQLVGAPLVFDPTPNGFSISVVLRSGSPSALRARVREQSSVQWSDLGSPQSPAGDVAQWAVEGLDPGLRYDYEIRVAGGQDSDQNGGQDGGQVQTLYLGSAITAREPGSAFTFAVLADSHILPRDPFPAGTSLAEDLFGVEENTLFSVASDIAAANPDFMINLGDMLDYHPFGYNGPPPDEAWARIAYLNYRRLLGDTLGHAAHFAVIGNWDGEDGFFTPEEIARSTSQRMLYLPGPRPDTYPQSGSPNEDYYAFTWGDALFVVLNVMTYTPTAHLLGADPGVPDDWTLGDEQRAWLEQTLAGASSKWRFLFIHHTVGGAAGDDVDSAYGRGGGQAARVGEQSIVHDMMLKYGVQIFFYGHDHVFTDMIVDGIHYTLPGSAGAAWKFDGSLTGYTQYWFDSGYGKVQVSPDHVQVDFVALGGQVLDSYTVE